MQDMINDIADALVSDHIDLMNENKRLRDALVELLQYAPQPSRMLDSYGCALERARLAVQA